MQFRHSARLASGGFDVIIGSRSRYRALEEADARDRELLNVLVSQSPADIEDNVGDVKADDDRLATAMAAYKEFSLDGGWAEHVEAVTGG